MIVHNIDQPGHVAEVTSMLAHKSVNIATMQLYRESRGTRAVMVIECDREVPGEAIEWLEHLEEHLKEIVNISGKDVHTLAADIEMHRREVHERIAREHPELAERFAQRRHLLDKHLKERRPEVYRIIVQLREDNKHK